METQTKKLFLYLILPLLLLGVALAVAYHQTKPDFRLHAHFYDNYALIQTYLGRQMIVDGGPNDGILKDLGHDLPFFDRTIDLVVLTQADAKHVSGLISVLKRYEVQMVLLPQEPSNLSVYQEFLKLIDEKKIKKVYAQSGQKIWLDPATLLTGNKLLFGKTEINLTDGQSHNVELISDGTRLDKK